MHEEARMIAGIETARVGRVGVAALVLGILSVFQSGSELLYQIGALAVLVGVASLMAVPLARRQPWQRVMERFTLLGMIVGILGMLQGWFIGFYEYGFVVLALATLGFIIISHIPVQE